MSTLDAARLRKAIVTGLAKAGIDADVTSKHVPKTRLYRFYVFANEFEEMLPSERQEVVWRIVDENVAAHDRSLISMIRTVTWAESDEGERPRNKGATKKRRRKRRLAS